jgi:hypothetical protein
MEKPCCSSDDHMPGLRGEYFKKKMEEDVNQARKNLKDFAFRKGRKHAVTVSTWSLFKRMGTIWSDQVHLMEEGYQKIGEGVVVAAAGFDTKGKRKAVDPPPAWQLCKEAEVRGCGTQGGSRGRGSVLRGRGDR